MNAAADPVADRAHRHEQAGEHEAVGVHDPELRGGARPQVLGDRRHGVVDYADVHRDQQERQQQDGEREPGGAVGALYQSTLAGLMSLMLIARASAPTARELAAALGPRQPQDVR